MHIHTKTSLQMCTITRTELRQNRKCCVAPRDLLTGNRKSNAQYFTTRLQKKRNRNILDNSATFGEYIFVELFHALIGTSRPKNGGKHSDTRKKRTAHKKKDICNGFVKISNLLLHTSRKSDVGYLFK